MKFAQSREEKRRYWRALSPGAALWLSGAVFCTFAALPFLQDITRTHTQSFGRLVGWSLFAGVSAALFIHVMRRSRRLFVVLVGVYIASTIALDRAAAGVPAGGPPDHLRLVVDANLALVLIMAGYALFLRFIEREGVRYFRIDTEIQLAHAVQRSLVPAVSLGVDGLEVHGRSHPSGVVGGDLIDVVSGNGMTTCLVADVSGHGIPAGVLMGMVKSAARAELLHSAPLSQLLTNLNRILQQLKQPDTFVTFACVRRSEAHGLEFALAGHPPLLHLSAASGEIRRAELMQLPLCLLQTAPYASGTIAAAQGDLLAIVSDGILEVSNEERAEFGLAGVERVLQQNRNRSLERIADAILAAARAHGPQHDDQTLLLIRT